MVAMIQIDQMLLKKFNLMLGLYVLGGPDGHEPVAAESFEEWAAFMEDGSRRRVAFTDLGPVYVSTVFLGTSPFGGNLFETMIFGGAHAQELRRADTWEEALRDHTIMVEIARSALNQAGEEDHFAE